MNIDLLKKIRAAAELSQVDFAKLFKKTSGWVAKIELGHHEVRNPEAKIYVKIAKKHGLNITLDDLYQ